MRLMYETDGDNETIYTSPSKSQILHKLRYIL
jgi:hypothetical protein